MGKGSGLDISRSSIPGFCTRSHDPAHRCRKQKELSAYRGGEVARRAIVGGSGAFVQRQQVLAIGDVVQVQRRAPVAVDVVAGHQVHQGV